MADLLLDPEAEHLHIYQTSDERVKAISLEIMHLDEQLARFQKPRMRQLLEKEREVLKRRLEEIPVLRARYREYAP